MLDNRKWQVVVIIVTWNSGRYLLDCLTALSNQSISKFKVLIVDNDSNDKFLFGQVRTVFPLAECISLKSNLGFAAANNYGVSKASEFDYIALLNPDTKPHRDWLKNLLIAAEQYPGCAAFGSHMVSMDSPEFLDGIGDEYHTSGRVWRKGHLKACKHNYPEVSEIFSPCAAAALYRRSAFVAANGFDADFFCYVEDVDLGFRLRLLGYKCLYINNAIVWHAGSTTTGGKHSYFSIYFGHRNLVWTFVKNMPNPLMYIYIPQHLLLNIVSLIWLSLRGHTKAVFRAKWDAIKGLPKIWRKRQAIQSRRIASCGDLLRVMQRGFPLRK